VNTTGNQNTTGSAAKLTTARAIQGVNFDGSAAITVVTAGTGVTVSGTQVSIGQAVATNSNVQFNSLGVGTAGSATAGEIRATNAITSFYSDERLKENITEIDNAIEKVMSLRGVTYNANQLAESFGYANKEEQVGVIAQDVEKVLPQIVKPAPFDIISLQEGIEISRSGENYKTVQYEKLVPLLIQANKEQQVMIEELQKKVGN
jgi:glutamate-1-semialdehyde aminotransferase